MSDETKPNIDLQDPLPESSWFWRRVFVFAVTAAVLWMLWGAIDRLGTVAVVAPQAGVPALLSLCKWILGFTALMVTYYMVAPSAEQIVKLLKVASLLRSGVQVTGRQVVQPGKTETVRATGLPPVAPAPEIPATDRRTAPKGDVEAPPPPPAYDGPPWDAPAPPPPTR